VRFSGVPTSTTTTPPSFSYESTVSGPAEASPRIVLAFSDGDNIYMGPTTWTADQWTVESGSGDVWNDAGAAGCPPLQNVSYGAALSCHTSDGSSVTSMYIVADNPSYPSGYRIYLDDISYDGTTIGGAAKGASTPQLTTFATLTRVGRHSGTGKLTVVCRTTSGEHCHFDLTLRRGGTVAGHITGVVAGNVSSKVSLTLTSAGRRLLAKHHVLGVHVSGKVTDDSGNSAPVSRHLTLVR
jgi:hypothetical protein